MPDSATTAKTALRNAAVPAALTDNSGGAAGTALPVIVAPAANATTSLTADMTAARDGIATLTAKVNALTALVSNLVTLALNTSQGV